MKLPGVDSLAGSVGGVSNAGAPGEAFQGLTKTLSEGLQLYTQELVKTQAQRASVSLSSQLEDLQLNLRSRKYITAAELRDAIGADADRLPPHVQTMLQKSDPETGDPVDNDEIPMWAVSGAIFEAQSKRILEAASSEITVGGAWRNRFKEHASGAVQQRKLKVNEQSMEASMTYMRETQLRDLDVMRNTASTPQEFDDIYAAISRSNVFDPHEKGAERLKTRRTEQLRPVWDALRLNDPEAMKREIARLNKPVIKNDDGSVSTERTTTWEIDGKHVVIPTIVDGKQRTADEALQLYKDGKNPSVGEFDSPEEADAFAKKRTAWLSRGGGTDAIEPEHRKMYVEQLESQLKTLEKEAKEAQVEARREVMRKSWSAIYNAQEVARKQGRPLPSSAYGLLPRPEEVDPDEWRQAHAYIDGLTKGQEPKTSPQLYATISRLATDDLENFKADKLTFEVNGKPQTFRLIDFVNQLSPEDFRKFTDLQRTAREAGAGSPAYTTFLSTEERVNAKLTNDLHYDLKATDEATLKQVGHLKGLIHATLVSRSQAKNNGKGGKLTPDEEDAAINEVLDREVKVKKNSAFWSFIGGSEAERTLGTLGVRPEVAVALYELSARGGKEFTPEQVLEQAADYAHYEPGVMAAWKAKAGGKPLKPDVAVQIYAQLKRDWGDIDARLAKAGKLTGDNAKDNPARTALAVQGYLKGIR